MSLIWTESCDIGNGSNCTWTAFSSSTSVIQTTDRYTGDSLGFAWLCASTNVEAIATKTFAASEHHSAFTVGMAILTGGTATANTQQRLLQLQDASGVTRLTVWLRKINTSTDSYSIEVRDGTSGAGTLRADSVTAIVDNTAWKFLEIKVVCAAATGSIEIRVNESSVLNVTNINTTGGLAGVLFGGILLSFPTFASSSSAQWTLDDIYVTNGGGSVNNTFLGDVRVLGYFPNADGASEEWVAGGSGNNATDHFENINNNVPSSQPYNSSNADEAEELYAYPNLPASATGQILGIHAKIGAWTTALNASVALLVNDGVDVGEGVENALTTTAPVANNGAVASIYDDIFETRPSGNLWLSEYIDALQTGVRVKSLT